METASGELAIGSVSQGADIFLRSSVPARDNGYPAPLSRVVVDRGALHEGGALSKA